MVKYKFNVRWLTKSQKKSAKSSTNLTLDGKQSKQKNKIGQEKAQKIFKKNTKGMRYLNLRGKNNMDKERGKKKNQAETVSHRIAQTDPAGWEVELGTYRRTRSGRDWDS